MNGTQQQRILQALVQASRTLGEAAAAIGGSGGAGGAIVVPSLYLDFLPPEFRDRPRDFFAYARTFTNLAAAGTATLTFTTQQDSDFLIVAIAGRVSNNGAPQTVSANPPLTVNVVDQGSGRQLFNEAVAWETVVGTAQLPFFLPYPKFIPRASDVSTTLVNLHAAQAFDVRLSYIGFKIFEIMR